MEGQGALGVGGWREWKEKAEAVAAAKRTDKAFKVFTALALPSRIQTDDAFETRQLSPESGWLALTRFSGSAKFNYTVREEWTGWWWLWSNFWGRCCCFYPHFGTAVGIAALLRHLVNFVRTATYGRPAINIHTGSRGPQSVYPFTHPLQGWNFWSMFYVVFSRVGCCCIPMNHCPRQLRVKRP